MQPEGNVMKRKIDQAGDKPVGSENMRAGDVIAALKSVMILCDMVFVNSVVLRRTRDVVDVGITGAFYVILHSGSASELSADFYLFGDLKQCFPSKTHLINKYFCEV